MSAPKKAASKPLNEPELPVDMTPPLKLMEELSATDAENRGNTPRPSKASMLFVTAMSAAGKKQWDDAFKKMQNAVEEAQKDPTHKEPYGISLCGLGYLLCCIQKYTEASECYAKSISIWETVLTPDSPKMAHLLADASTIYSKLKNLDKAIEYLERSRVCLVKGKGDKDPEAMGTLCGIADLKAQQHNFGDAEKFYKQAISTLIGTGHPSVTMAMKMYHGFLVSQKKTQEAAELEKQIKEFQAIKH